MSATKVKKASKKAKPKSAKAKPSPKLVKNDTSKARAPKNLENRELVEELKQVPQARDGEKSGEFIRRVLELNALTTQEVVELVTDNYPSSKVTANDVSFHRYHMKKDGVDVRVVRMDKNGNRYALKA